MSAKTFTVIVEEDENGDLIIPLPKELSEGDYPWLVGDTLEWDIEENPSGSTNPRVVITNMSWMHRNEDGFG